MLQQSGETFANYTSVSFGFLTKTLPRRISHWFGESTWNGRGILVCTAELALVALSFLSTASFFSGSGGAYLPTKSVFIFLSFTLVLRGIALQFFGVCDRSFRHAGIADAIAIGKAVGTSSLVLYLVSLVP